MVPSTFLSYLEDEVKEIKSLFQAGNYNNNLFKLNKYLDQFHGLQQEIHAQTGKRGQPQPWTGLG